MRSDRSRRHFLAALATGGFAVATGGLSRVLANPATGAPWGDYPVDDNSFVPPAQQAKNVLEIFLWGGLSPWETFYVVDEAAYGKAQSQMWWTFQDGPVSVAAAYQKCAGSGPLLMPFAQDANGVMVQLGPFIDGLRTRKDITDRLRIHVVSHDLTAHEIACPIALTGYRLGSPKLAGVGAAVQHYHFSHATGPSTEPSAYVISPTHRKAYMLGSAIAIGQHPGYARPMALDVQTGATFTQALTRSNVGASRAQSDALLQVYGDIYGSQLRTTQTQETLRSAGMDAYQYAAGALGQSDNLLTVLGGQLPPLQDASVCGMVVPQTTTNPQLQLAAHLLTRPGSAARHVLVADQGIVWGADFGYDSHHDHIANSSVNLTYFSAQLAAIINQPGENNPAKINLDETLVVLNTEFGRSPYTQPPVGRTHYPNAYVTMMFGGPIGAAQRGIVGAIQPDGTALNPIGPAETRIATLAALGIYPFEPEGYAVSDVAGAQTRVDAGMLVKSRVLGLA